MTATKAAGYATGAQRLLLTHFWPGSDRAVSLRQAQAVHLGEVLVAEEELDVRL